LVRLTTEGLKAELSWKENLQIVASLLNSAKQSPIRELYTGIGNLDELLETLVEEMTQPNNTLNLGEITKLWIGVDHIAERMRAIIQHNSNSRAFKESDILQQAWDYLAQVEIERCILTYRKGYGEREQFEDSIVRDYEALMRTRTDVLQSRSSADGVVWMFHPEKYMLYWHVVRWNGGNLPVDFVRPRLERWERDCHGYVKKLRQVLAGFGPFTGSSYALEWRKGTITLSSIEPTSNAFVLNESLKRDWRY
jgi:hypothetical protein